jgi:phytol kinase
MALDTLWLNVMAAALWLGLVGAAALAIDRVTPLGSEWTRKVVHIGTGNIVLIAWWLKIPAWIGIGAAVLFSGVAILSYMLPLLPSINNIGRKSFGTLFYAMSIGLLVAWFWPLELQPLAALGILVMAWGDGLAGLVGRQFGHRRYRLLGMTKSWEGSGTMGLVSFGVSAWILLATGTPALPSLLVALGVSMVATVLEAFSPLGIDNLTVPLGSSAMAYLLLGLF